MKRIEGIDSLRAICALWVLFSHFGGPPLLAGIDKSNRIGWLINGIYNNFWNGPAAVIVFFVISGFCIHYPQSASRRLDSLFAFYLKRLVRISIPMGIAILVSSSCGGSLDLLNESILWSLVCEIIYYLIYPLMLMFVRIWSSWIWLFVGSFVASLVLAGTKPDAGNYASFGPWLNWILGLPCWIMGCMVAEWMTNGWPLKKQFKFSIWLIRGMVFICSVLLSVLRFHTFVGYPWTLNFFGVLASLWFFIELQHFSQVKPTKVLEYIGVFSYSIYLMHVPLHEVFSKLDLPSLGYVLNWLISNSVIIFGCWIFFLLIEKPSHFLARWLGQKAVQMQAQTKDI
jgi:peptidoglycan/LPS O-acetylase OafA/YrhL